MSKAIDDVIAERAAHESREGYDANHDNEHVDRELARAAECYLDQYVTQSWLLGSYKDGLLRYQDKPSPDMWPWSEVHWKPKGPRSDLVRAASLLIAEIERLDRASTT